MKIGLNIVVEKKKNISIVRIEGRLDVASTPILEKKLLEQINEGIKNIILDFSQLHYLSSSGMRLLLSVTKKLANIEGALHCCSIVEEVMEIIKIAGFEHIIYIFPTENEALQAF